MKVLLTGATGYIGSAVADALRAAGHQVIGLARSETAARRLETRNIRVRRGDLNDAESLTQAAREADAVIHTASTNDENAPRADKAAVQALLSALEGSGKPFIYTSGVWVLGNTGEKIATEESPLNPAPLVAWRPAHEQLVLTASGRGVRSVVIRPAIVYGRGGGIPAGFIRSARKNGAVRFVGTGENRWSFVHVDDLADLYVRALEQAPAATLLHAASGPSLRVREVAEAASAAAGVPGKVQAWPADQARQELGPLADALALDQQVSGAKATQLLQWSPQAPSLLEEFQRSLE